MLMGCLSCVIFVLFINEVKLVIDSKKTYDKFYDIDTGVYNENGVIFDNDNSSWEDNSQFQKKNVFGNYDEDDDVDKDQNQPGF